MRQGIGPYPYQGVVSSSIQEFNGKNILFVVI